MKLLTFAEDVAASGGYYVLTAGDEVYAHDMSIVGSIGVITMKLDITKWLKTRKIDVRHFQTDPTMLGSISDPSNSLTAAQEETLKKILGSSHEAFLGHVEMARAKHLKGTLEERKANLYQGNVWTGLEAQKLGLVDKIGNYQQVLPLLYPDNDICEIKKPSGIMQSLTGIKTYADNLIMN